MAVDMFFKIGDIKGDSIDSTHKDETEVLAWSWGMSQSGSTHSGTGGGAGKVNVQDISFTKYIDKGSTVLMLYCCNGTHIPEAKLTVRKAGANPVEYLIITFNDMLITSVSTGGSGGEDRLTENVTINFAKVKVSFSGQKADGTAEAAAEMGWNIPENVKM